MSVLTKQPGNPPKFFAKKTGGGDIPRLRMSSFLLAVYVLLTVQLILFFLYFTGRWFLIPAFLEFCKVLVQTQIYILQASVKWIVPQRKRLSGETVLITGAASGIGRLIALSLGKKGCKVVLWDINTEAVGVVAEEIHAAGGVAVAYQCNVCDRDMVRSVAGKVKEEVGDVSLLINNAGVVTGKKLLECSEQDICKTFEVNSLAHFWTIKAFLPGMLEKNHGHIVSTASVAGYIGLAGTVDYCASKFAAVGLMQSLRREVNAMGKNGVNFTTICPSLITTGMFDGVKFRFPHFPGFGILTPEYAAMRIVDAIEKEQIQLMMPWGCYLSTFLQNILPERATDLLLKFLGADIAMDTFVGRDTKTKPSPP